MSKKAAIKQPECKSVTDAQSIQSFGNLKSALKLSGKIVPILESAYAFLMKQHQFNRKQIRTLETSMNKLYQNVVGSENVALNDIMALAFSYQVVSNIYVDSRQKEELRMAKEPLTRCANLVKDKELSPKFVLIALNCHCRLGFIYYRQKKIEKSVQACNRGVELYLTYTQEVHRNPIDLENFIIQSSVSGYWKLKDMYKYILTLLTKINTTLGHINDKKFITYKHLLLAAELGTLEETKKTEDCINWIARSVILSDYLVKYNRFTEARSHIATAVYVKKFILDKMYKKIEQKLSGKVPGLVESSKRSNNIFAIAWVTYGLTLLRRSAERLLRLEKDENPEISNLKSKATSEGIIMQRLLLFKEVEREIPLPHEYQPKTVKFISNYNDAYKLFIDVIIHLYNIWTCIDPIKDVNTHMQVVLSTCKAYKYMELYEKDETSRTSMQNQQVIILSEAIKKKTFSGFPKVLRIARLQLASAYSTLIDANLDKLETLNVLHMPQRHVKITFEIENLVLDALTNLKMYIFCH